MMSRQSKCIALMAISTVFAFHVDVIAQNRSVQSSEEIVRSLQIQPQTRSILGGSTSRNLQAMVDLTINFDFDSANLRESSKEQLKNLSLALKDQRLQGLRFRVEGHTDGVGSSAYNDDLSERRAVTVVQYLNAEGIPLNRLESVGKGFREPLFPNDLPSPQNRRVRILTLQ